MLSLPSTTTNTHNQKAKLAADYNDLLKELSSPKMLTVGCYSIGETIGEGTYGKVKLGYHQITGRRVAIKKISKQHAPLMAREIHHHRQLKHPNIVTLFEILTTESAIYVVCEHCPNGELFDLLTSSGRFSEQRAQSYFRQLIHALRHCHERGIVHRDLKLENILLDADNRPKICDFGFARQVEDRQLLETFCGSLAYSAPEIISRRRYTGPETDVWSMGVILYTLLAGELPFDDDNEVVMQRKIVNLDYEMPAYFSPEAKDLITNLLRLDPTKRLTTDQIMNHPWLTMAHDEDNDTVSTDVDSLFSRVDEDDDVHSELSSPHWSPHPKHMAQKPSLASLYADRTRYGARPPRFSAPTVSKNQRIPQLTAACRASLPSAMPSHAKSFRMYAPEEPALTPIEEKLFAALTAAGFDQGIVRRMRSADASNALGTLWHMLMDNLIQNEAQKQTHVAIQTDITPRQTVSSPLIASPTMSRTAEKAAAEDASVPPAPRPLTSVSTGSGTDKQQQQQQQQQNQQQTSGWFTSVKSWFGKNDDRRNMRSETISPPTLANTDMAAPSPPVYASGHQKYRRHGLQLKNPPTSEVDKLTYNATASKPAPPPPQPPPLAFPAATHNKPSLDSYYKAGNAYVPPRPATALMLSSKRSDTLSVVTTPDQLAHTSPVVSTAAVEMDMCERRYAHYRNLATPAKSPMVPSSPVPIASVSTPPALSPSSETPSSAESSPAHSIADVAQDDTSSRSSSNCTSNNSKTISNGKESVPSSSSSPENVPAIVAQDPPQAQVPASTAAEEQDPQRLQTPPAPVPTRSWPMAFRDAPSKRFELSAPRSQLGIYNSHRPDGGRRKPLGAKVIIEEEEEEE
ncbi:hypothetical protein BCR43DRAFT_489935 [Syncephalastrum racemosum]|uniref:Protein kinase domain-containing protein n=1 Tax=Syncephalastrum racemosum TaxID=13706 RepID=A0A1X2HEZ7_SYNRA|nr:hypothetical protein BCR43DRAFT_489935 [Syncephalastrum racemosum]